MISVPSWCPSRRCGCREQDRLRRNQEARNCLADDHRAEVPNVGLFCGVGARVVDDDFTPVLEFFCAALVVGLLE